MSPEEDAKEHTTGRQPTESPRQPHIKSKAMASKAERAERVAAEMRKNLMKRKQQQRTKQDET